MGVGSLSTTPLKKGFMFAPAIGIDVAVCKFGLDGYESESESKVVWPSNSVEGCREWSRQCWFNNPN